MTSFERTSQFSAIYVIEFIEPQDPQTGTQLFEEVIKPRVAADDIYTRFFKVNARTEFLAALEDIIGEVKIGHLKPILHIDAHGSSEGFHRHLNDRVSWADIRPYLTRLNVACAMNLLITVAACYGLNMVRVMSIAERCPFWALLGPDEQVLPSDVRAGFRAYYTTLLDTLDLNEAANALRAADSSWPQTWHFRNAELIFADAYGQYLANFGSSEARSQRERDALANATFRGAVNPLTVRKTKEKIRELLGNEQGDFDRIKNRFLMLDLFPENAERFPIGMLEAKKLSADVEALLAANAPSK